MADDDDKSNKSHHLPEQPQTSASSPSIEFRPHLSVVIGADGSDGSEDLQHDMRRCMQSFAVDPDDGAGMPESTVFLEDADVILPSTSHAGSSSLCELLSTSLRTMTNTAAEVQPETGGTDLEHFVRDFFNKNTRFTAEAKEAETNFLEEIFTEKPPKILQDYLFGNVIGEGSYSKVKEVVHVKTLVRRAVKILKDKRLRKIPGGEQNVQREIEVLRRLSHPNVVKVVDIFRLEERHKLYIVMEFCVCSLQQLLDNCAEKMLPEFQAHLYFTQLIEGLDFLHGQRIIHKDIKPGNLLLSLAGVLKICDLGVAELLNSMVGEQSDWCTLVQGTPKFQPPEVVSGTQQRFRGRLVDIWACGVTLYNMISGCYPFDGDVIMKLFEDITKSPLKMPPNVSKPLEQLLTGMLQKEPEKRWDSLKIRASKWFSMTHQIDKQRIVQIPAIKDTPAHRPLGIYEALIQMYAQDEEEVMEQLEEARIGDDRRKEQSQPDASNTRRLEQQHRSDAIEPNRADEDAIEMKPFLTTTSSNNNSRRRKQRRRRNLTKLCLVAALCTLIVIIIVVVLFVL